MKRTGEEDKEQEQVSQPETEYHLDYRSARPNRFAGKVEKGGVAIMLDPDIAEGFTDSKTVNDVLRALIQTMPPTYRKSKRPRATPSA